MNRIKELTGHASGIYALSADAQLLYSASGDGMVASWDLETLEPAPFSVKVGMPVYALLKWRDYIFVGQQKGGVHVINLAEKKEEKHIQIHKNGVYHLLINESTNQLYSAGGDGSLGIFDLDGFRLQMQVSLSHKKLRRMTLSPQGDLLLVSGSDGNVFVFETNYFNELYRFEAHENGTYALAWTPEGKLITGGRDAHMRFWEVKHQEAKMENEIPAHNYAIYDLALSEHGVLASASRDKIVKTWQPPNYNFPERLKAERTQTHKNSANSVLWVGDKLFSASDDRTIAVWAHSNS